MTTPVHPQDIVTFVAAVLGALAALAGEPGAAGIMIGAATVGVVLTVGRVWVIQ